MTLNFGIHKDKSFDKIPIDYLQWVAKPKYSGKFYKSLHVTDLKWKVPFASTVAARKYLFDKGWILIGERWEHGEKTSKHKT